MAYIFISYSRKDGEFARRLAEDLDLLGAGVWIDVEGISSGSNWSSAIQTALDTAEVMLLIVSPDSMASENVQDEWQYFKDQRRLLIPILWRPTKIHFQLHRLQHVDFYSQDYPAALDRLCDELIRQGIDVQAPRDTTLSFVPFTAGVTPPVPVSDEFIQAQTPPGFWLVMRRGPAMNQVYALDRQRLTLGRDVANDIVIQDSELSRHHCRFTRDGSGYMLEDLQSTNGTFINGKRMTGIRPLTLGDMIGLGETVTLQYGNREDGLPVPLDAVSVFRLVVRRGPQPGQIYCLDRTIISIGRDLTNDVVIPDSELSRHHCRFTRGEKGYALEDLASTNGTFVNGQRLSGVCHLFPGDMVGLGEMVTLAYEEQP